MRLRLKWIIILVIVVAFAWLQHDSLIQRIALAWQSMHDQRFQDDTTRTTTFKLKSDDWVTFQIPSQAVRLRVVTNAALHATPPLDVFDDAIRPGWRYAVDYQLIDETDSVLHEATYHFRANISQYRHPETNETFTASFFGNTDFVPIQSRTMTLELDHYQRTVNRLRMRIANHDPAIAEVTARTIIQQPRPDFEKPYAWSRLSHERRDELCRSNVYTEDLLTDLERANLLRLQWERTAPIGRAHDDFTPRVLYSLNEIKGEEIGEPELPMVFFAEPGLRATIPIPAAPGRVRLDLELTNDRPEGMALDFQAIAETSTKSVEVLVSWFGLTIHQRETSLMAVAHQTESIELDVDGGLVEITSNRRVRIIAHWQPNESSDLIVAKRGSLLDKDPGVEALQTSTDDVDDGSGENVSVVDITPSAQSIETYLVGPERTVRYLIHSVATDRTPLRIVLRNFVNATTSENCDLPDRAVVDWVMKDRDGAPIHLGTLRRSTLSSEYDFISDGNSIFSVSDPVEFFFNVPHDASTIEFSGGMQVLLAAYTRPSQEPIRTQVPDDYHPFHRHESLNRRWFSKQPVGHEAIFMDGGKVAVRVQSRPPVDNEQILAGNYDWEDFRPSDGWKGRFLLEPQSPKTPLRPDAIDTSYWRLKVNQANQVRVVSAGQDIVRPSLIYWTTTPTRLFVELDGEVLLDRMLYSTTGTLELPEVRTEDRDRQLLVRIEDSALVFVNHLQCNNGLRHLKRLAQIPTNNRLNYLVSKRSHDEELLMLRVFLRETARQICTVRMRIIEERAEQDQPFDSWTFRRRNYDLRTSASTPVIGLATDAKVNALQYACYVSLGKDLPPGEYHIEFECEDAGCFLLYRTIPGKSDRLNIYQE